MGASLTHQSSKVLEGQAVCKDGHHEHPAENGIKTRFAHGIDQVWRCLHASTDTGVNQYQSASWGNRHVYSSHNGGMPTNAVGFLSEGNFAIARAQEARFVEPLTSELRELGLTEENWAMCQDKLRHAYCIINPAAFSSRNSYSEAIATLNDLVFREKKCHAVYAEYGGKGGQAAMTVYTQEQWDKLPKKRVWWPTRVANRSGSSSVDDVLAKSDSALPSKSLLASEYITHSPLYEAVPPAHTAESVASRV